MTSGTAGCSSNILDGYLDAGTFSDALEGDASATSTSRDASGDLAPFDAILHLDAFAPDAAVVVDAPEVNPSVDANLMPLDTAIPVVDSGLTADAGLATASVTATLVALQGGDVPLGGAKITALKGSVAADKTIVLSSFTAIPGIPNTVAMRGMVYSVEPSEIVFDAPVEITLPIADPLLQGESAYVARYDEASKSWIGQPTKWNIASNVASVLVTKGGRFAVFAGSGDPGNVNRSCPTTTACGGTLLGAFKYASSCTNVPSATSTQACGSADADIVSSNVVEGTIAFFSSGSFLSDTTGFTRADVRSNAGCTNYFKNIGDLSCPDLASRVVHSQLYTWHCSGTMNDRCFCTGMIALAGAREELTGTFAVLDNGRLSLTSGGSGQPKTLDYCVQGASLTFRDGQGVFTATSTP